MTEGINTDWSLAEFARNYYVSDEGKTRFRRYPMLTTFLEGQFVWVDFERDLSKIRHISKGNMLERTTTYQRHKWTWWFR